ncbi:LacI family transcriptional regulator [Paenibacillus sp. CCS19]|uniref:LacI family DNA-binding transcriptional regulator n=1 Tax=Paenibacillus sp. CCS19 TaxID=3158387 RepID=UPI002560F05E|nr:LacI family DNA-binding transcriptional regulator [Paenibacillus cellulosilyticus]GMK39430.1 LacI family transcriptional regulator [Paenibacillus cellulosilyticus]
MSKTKVTIQDIADSLGLSRNTISKALNNHYSIPDETRNKVIQKAIEMNYKQFAFFEQEVTAAKKSGNIALLTANMPNNSHFGTSLLSGLEQKISSEGFNLSIHMVRENEINSLALPVNFDKSKVDGIVCIELFNKNYSEFISSLEIPTLFIDASAALTFTEMKSDILLMENAHSIFSMTRRLIDEGITTFGFIGDFNHCMSFNERWDGFNKALSTSRIDLDESFCILEEDRYVADYQWLKQRLSGMKELPSAFICANDFIAIHVIRILKDLNVRVPEEVMVCGFDNATESQIVEPHLTTVHIHRSEMGYLAAEMLLSRMENPDRPPQVTHVKTIPVYRQSTGHV